MLRYFRHAALLVLLCQLAGCANAPVDPNELPATLVLKKGLVLPLNAGIGIYVPEGAAHFSEIYGNQIVQRGRFTRDAINTVAAHFYKTVVLRDQPTADPIQLMLGLDPKWTAAPGKMTLELPFHLFDAKGTPLRSGTKSATLTLEGAPDVMLTNLAITVMQQVMVDIVNSPEANVGAAAATTVDAFPASLLIDEKSPYRLGTGFFINASGQLLTSASLAQGCLRINVGASEAQRTGTLGASSVLLNLAVLDTGASAPSTLSFAADRPALGSATNAVSFLRAKEGDATRGLSFGNVVSLDGAANAFGVFQFSTATKPATFGAPIVGADGRLVGIYNGGYPYDFLQKQGLLPANTYQGLHAELAAEFLRRNQIAFSSDNYPDTRAPVDRVTAATVQVACYQ